LEDFAAERALHLLPGILRRDREQLLTGRAGKIHGKHHLT